VSDPAKIAAQDDIGALGVCAFEALTGRLPKKEEDGGVADPLAGVIARALATGSAGFASMKDLVGAIQEAAPRAREKTQLLEASPRARNTSTRAPSPSPSPSSPSPSPAPETPAAAPAPPPPTAGPEQRRFARAPYRTPVRIEVPGIGVLDGRSEDVSGGGLLVVSRGGLSAGTQVTVRFALPLDGKVVAEAAVVKWSRAARADETSGRALGIELTSPSQESSRQIERYVSLMGDGSEATFVK
jgi:hypothetical protein